jgi:shikimate dehydrogenase
MTFIPFRKNGEKMKKYCLIGWPLKHSLSPDIHNFAFKKLEIDALYEKFEINPDNFEQDIKTLKNKYSGFNVTIPYKTRIIPYLDILDQRAKDIGAVNTVCKMQGKWKGYNTDLDGFIAPLLSLNRSFKKCLLIGSGGAARAVIYSLIYYLAPEYILMGVIEFDQAEQLKNDFKQYAGEKHTEIEIYPVDKVNNFIPEMELIINATPLGTTPDIDRTPLPEISRISGGTVVYDLVYNPIKTRIQKDVKQFCKSCITINGLEMLVGQAAAAFTLWTDHEMPQKEILTHLKNILK